MRPAERRKKEWGGRTDKTISTKRCFVLTLLVLFCMSS